MGAVASLPLRWVGGESAIPASQVVVVSEQIDSPMSAEVVFKQSSYPSGKLKQYVVLKPRIYEETARHFLRITTAIDWPLDEPDVD